MRLKWFFFSIVPFLFVGTLVFGQDNKRKPKILEESVSKYQEVHPVISSDGNSMYFTRIGHPDTKYAEGGEDIWKITKDGSGKWSSPQHVSKSLNLSKYNMAIGFVNKDTLLIKGVFNKKGTQWKDRGVSYIRKTRNGWSKPVPLKLGGIVKNSHGNYFAGSIASGGKFLALTLGSSKKKVSSSIYLLERENSNTLAFKKAQKLNLDFVTTDYRRAFVTKDGTKIYFSALDSSIKEINIEEKKEDKDNIDVNASAYPYSVYVASREKQDNNWSAWSTPVLLGDSINVKNSSTWGVVLFPNEKEYVTNSSDGNANIYTYKEYKKPKPVLYDEVTLEGRVLNKKTRQPITTHVTFVEKEFEIPNVKFDSLSGKYTMLLKTGKRYFLQARTTKGQSGIYDMDLLEKSKTKTLKKDFLLNIKEIDTTIAEVSGYFIEESNKGIIPLDENFVVFVNGKKFENIEFVNGEKYKISLKKGKKYTLEGKSKGYISRTTELKILEKDEANINQDLFLSKIEVNKAIKLNNILFETSKATLKESSYVELYKVFDFLEENAEAKIEIMGHTDSHGSPKKNLILSQQRAIGVKNFLLDLGIKKNRIKTRGYGITKPIDTNSTREGRANNRRVEFKLLDL